MNLSFEFAAPFALVLGEKNISLTVEQNALTLERAIALIFELHPETLKKLMINKMVKDGMMDAMFISNNQLLNKSAILTDRTWIKVLSPICGG